MMGSKSGGSSMQQPMPAQSGGPNPQAMSAYNQAMPQFQPNQQQGGMGQNYNPSLYPFQSAQQYSNIFPMNAQFMNAARQNGYTPPPAYNPFNMQDLNAARAAHTFAMPPQPSPQPPPPLPNALDTANQKIGAFNLSDQDRSALPTDQLPQDPAALNAARQSGYTPPSQPFTPPPFIGGAMPNPQAQQSWMQRHPQYNMPPIDPQMMQYLSNFLPHYFAKGGSVDDNDEVGMALDLADKIFNSRHHRG